MHRVEDQRLLTGHGTFVDDVVRPGMLHACFVRSPFPRARLLGIDASAALDLEGVHAVFTAADLNPEVHELWYSMIGKDIPDTPRPLLAEGEARFVGDPVALVVADDRYLAEDAVDLVEVDYEPLTPVVDYVVGQDAEELVHEGYERNIAGRLRGGDRGRARRRRSRAPPTSSARRSTSRPTPPCPIETRGLVVEWSGGELTIWAATQAPHEVRAVASRVLGLDEHRIRVIMRDTGGGFGQKVVPFREDLCVIARGPEGAGAAEVDRGPAREPDVGRAGPPRARHGRASPSPTTARSSAATIEHVQDVGAYPTPWPVGTSAAVGMMFPGPYRIPVATWATTSVFSNTPGRTAYRGPWAFESVAREVLLDIAARRIGMDPVELRRRNFLAARRPPVRERRRHALRPHVAARGVRGRPREARLRRLPPRAGGRAAEGRLPRRRAPAATWSRRRPAWASTAPRAPPSASSRRARSTCTWPADPPGTASRRPPCSSPPTPSASTSTTSTPSRATPRSRPSASAPAGAAAAR